MTTPLSSSTSAAGADLYAYSKNGPLSPVETSLYTINTDTTGVKLLSGALEALERPMDIDVGALNSLLSQLQKRVTEQSTKSGAQAIKLTAQEQKDITKKNQDAQAIADQKAREARDAAPSSAMNWVMAAVSILGAGLAVAAAVSSFGVGIPAAICACSGAALAVSQASMSVTNAAEQDKGTMVRNYDGSQQLMNVSWSGMVDRIVDAQLGAGRDSPFGIVMIHQNGNKWFDANNREVTAADMIAEPNKFKTAEQLETYRMAWSISAELIAVLAGIACGVGAYKAAAGAARAVEFSADASRKIAAQVERAMELIGGLTDLGAAGATVYTSTQEIKTAELQADSDRARADKAFFEAQLKDIAARMKLSNDMVNQLVARLNQVYDSMFAGMAASNRTIADAAHNMGVV